MVSALVILISGTAFCMNANIVAVLVNVSLVVVVCSGSIIFGLLCCQLNDKIYFSNEEGN